MAPPSEAEVLTNYLIRPASLEAIVTLEWVAERIPPSQRENPQVRALWQDLVAQRERALEAVRANIENEARRGVAMRREVLREKREAEREDVDGEVELERALFGTESGAKALKHTLHTIIPEIDGATTAVETEIERLKEEETALLDSVRQIIGGLSDLRYGKFTNGQLKDEVLEGLTALQETCNGKT